MNTISLVCLGTALLTGCRTGTGAPGMAVGSKTTPLVGQTLSGASALGDWTTDAPGVRRKITVADLPEPYETPSVDNGPQVVRRPDGAWPRAPAGFKVQLYATGLINPREIVTAPNGDIFIAESARGRIHLMRGATADGKPAINEVFATGLDQPFGIAFYPPGPDPRWIYIGNTGSVVRFPYHNGDLHATGRAEMILPDIPSGGRLRGGGHWTRDVRFSADGKHMFVSVGSATNIQDHGPGPEYHRADILVATPDGHDEQVYASGIRNAVGLAIQPGNGQLWASVNERDGMGDNLPPDYITRIKAGGFYGWPWFYIGDHPDSRLQRDPHTQLASNVLLPDVLLQAHSASLCMTFYTGSSFPRNYWGQAFAAEHGSWNRRKRTGYKIIRVVLKNGVPTGEYEDFLTGFVISNQEVWGRPVGVTVARDGALIVTDDGGNCVWRVQYSKGEAVR